MYTGSCEHYLVCFYRLFHGAPSDRTVRAGQLPLKTPRPPSPVGTSGHRVGVSGVRGGGSDVRGQRDPRTFDVAVVLLWRGFRRSMVPGRPKSRGRREVRWGLGVGGRSRLGVSSERATFGERSSHSRTRTFFDLLLPIVLHHPPPPAPRERTLFGTRQVLLLHVPPPPPPPPSSPASGDPL